MYPTSLEYQEKIKKTNRTFKLDIQVRHSKGILNLTDKDIIAGSVMYSESSQAGEDFTIGNATASSFQFSIFNKPEYDEIDFTGAVLLPSVSLLVREGADAHFLQPSQPSKIPGFEDIWEPIPFGIFNVDKPKRFRSSIQIKAADNMIKFDKPYKLSTLSYPATLYQIYVNACNVCDVSAGTISFPNMDYMVTERPNGNFTFRDIIKYVAQLAGSFAKVNRQGALELKWYQATNLELTPSNRFNLDVTDDIIQIKGITATIGGVNYLIGTDEYTIDITNNPLLQNNFETALTNIFNNIKNTIFIPYNSQWQGNPAIQAGDIITQIDIDGKIYNTLVTHSTYRYRGRSNLSARGITNISKGYKGSTDKMFTIIKQRVEEDIGDQLTTLEQAQLDATQLLANMLGGHFINDKENGVFYIADNPDVSKAVKVWKWGIDGFGYYPDGLNNPPSTTVTSNNTITAMTIAASIISANMVQTGILQSNNGKSFFNLDSGIFRISHGGIEYTQADINGFGRNYGNGILSYLNGIYMEQFEGGGYSTTAPPPVRVTIPQKFKGRQDTVKVFALPTDMDYRIGRMSSGSVSELSRTVRTRVGVAYTFVNGKIVYSMDLNADTPWVDVDAYTYANTFTSSGTQISEFDRIGFILVVIGE